MSMKEHIQLLLTMMMRMNQDKDNNQNIYKNPKGTIFLTVGTGGAHDMQLSSLKDFSVEGIAGEFGILNIQIESDQTPLSGQFIKNGKKQKIVDEFKIIKKLNIDIINDLITA